MTETKPAEPRPAPRSTVLLLRDGPAGTEVFMVVRHREIEFAARRAGLPGGRVETADAETPRRSAPPIRWAPSASPPSARPSRKAACCWPGPWAAWRSIRPRARPSPPPTGCAECRQPRLRRPAAGGRAGAGCRCPGPLRPLGHAGRPHQAVRHAFFLAAAPPDHAAAHDGHEAMDSVWITPAQALAEADAGQLTLVSRRGRTWEKLAEAADLAAALAAAAARPVVTVQPALEIDAAGRKMLRIPVEAGYGGPTLPGPGPGGDGAGPPPRRSGSDLRRGGGTARSLEKSLATTSQGSSALVSVFCPGPCSAGARGAKGGGTAPPPAPRAGRRWAATQAARPGGDSPSASAVRRIGLGGPGL